MAMSSKRTFILLFYVITPIVVVPDFVHCSLVFPHSLFDSFNPGLMTFDASSARCESAFAAALRRPILAPDFLAPGFISRSDSVPTLFVYIRWGFRPGQCTLVGARWAWVFLTRACGTTSSHFSLMGPLFSDNRSQFTPLGARWAWVFGTTSRLAAADRSCWFFLNRNFSFLT